MVVAELALYHLARALSRSEVAHSNEMKAAMRDASANAAYRADEVAKVIAAVERYHINMAGADVLDLGCNDGALTVQYAARGPRSVIGVDIDAGAIERAKRDRSVPGVEYRLSETTALPLDSESIDTIVCYDVFEHVAKPSALLAECRRVLRPNGKMLIGSWGWFHPFAPHLWSTMPVPWAHVAVSERTLLRACRRVYHAPWYTPVRHDFDANGNRKPDSYQEESISTDYLNKFLIKDFEKAFEESGMRWSLDLRPFGAAPWSKPLLSVPFLREFIHGYFWAVLQKTAAH
jgi:ubiquinone/menaquinone biosynthesis C-methylase UbiE